MGKGSQSNQSKVNRQSMEALSTQNKYPFDTVGEETEEERYARLPAGVKEADQEASKELDSLLQQLP